MLDPDGIIHLQQDHSSIHDSRVVQEWLSRQADIELIDWQRLFWLLTFCTSAAQVGSFSKDKKVIRSVLVNMSYMSGQRSVARLYCQKGKWLVALALTKKFSLPSL
jgi:hypothetical protein